MKEGFLVEMSDGSLLRKRFEDLRPNDRLVVDGPDAFASTDAAQCQLDQEIEAAGGIEAWRQLNKHRVD